LTYKIYNISITNEKLQKKLDKDKENAEINFSAKVQKILEKSYNV